MSETTKERLAERPDPLEWGDGYWQLDQAILDATDAKRPVWQIAVLTQIRDEWERTREDAKLGAALRAAFAEVESLHQLAIFRPIRGEIGALIEHSIAPGAVQIESDATRALAALLRSSPGKPA